jgi:RNA polymerase sigma factor (sigma-70 family)
MLREEQETLTLIQEVLGKNKVAEEKFYYRNKEIIEDYIRYKLPKVNSDDFDDCVQYILIKIFFNLDKYDPEKSSLKSWVIAITKNFMIDAWRANPMICVNNNTVSITNSSPVQATINNSYATSSDITCSCNNTGDLTLTALNNSSNMVFFSNGAYTTACNNVDFENCNSVNYISEQISSQDFTLLNMKYVQGYEYCEIGKEFEISSNTASNRVNYIKTKIKNNLKEIHD